jgi:hypothetical protein
VVLRLREDGGGAMLISECFVVEKVGGERCAKDMLLSCAAMRICQLLPDLNRYNWQVRGNGEGCMRRSCITLSRGVGDNFVDIASLARPHADMIRLAIMVGCVGTIK